MREERHHMRKCRSLGANVGEEQEDSPPAPSGHASGGHSDSPRLTALITGAEMEVTEHKEMTMYYQVNVLLGAAQETGGARRRYSEFARLSRQLNARYPRLLAADGVPIPPFPKKTLLRAGWEPEVVVERVQGLGEWLQAICAKLQCVSPELVAFLNVPMYCAIRMLSGDLRTADLVGPCSPDSVMSGEGSAGSRRLNAPASHMRSPQVDRASLGTLGDTLQHSVQRPGYNESALYVARALCAHALASGLNTPSLDEAHRFVRAICGRALFKPCSLIAAVVYLDRVKSSMLRALLHGEGWAVTLLVVLVVAAKVYDSDYPISNADICSPIALPQLNPPGAPPMTMRRVNECERRLLGMLDYNTLISQAEFAKYYLTLPFAFPTIPAPRHIRFAPGCAPAPSSPVRLLPTGEDCTESTGNGASDGDGAKVAAAAAAARHRRVSHEVWSEHCDREVVCGARADSL